jgi:hypothetical protein
MIEVMLEAMITTANTTNRVLYLKIFHEKVASMVRDGPNIGVIIRTSKTFRNITQGKEVENKL